MLTLDGTWQSFAESFSRNAPYIISTVLWVYWSVGAVAILMISWFDVAIKMQLHGNFCLCSLSISTPFYIEI